MEGSAHGIPISFVTESLHSAMLGDHGRDHDRTQGDHGRNHGRTQGDHGRNHDRGRGREGHLGGDPTPCAKAIAAACPHLSGAACKACVAKHAAAIMPKCPTPGQVDGACGSRAADDMGTIFPMPAGQGASWNRSLVRAVAAAIAAEARASGADRGFSPELQVATDPRFGRTQENFGGDPHLVSELGVAATLGLHGGDTAGPTGYLPNYNTSITSEAKHYAVYGFGDADGSPADVSIPTLYDIYLRPWKAYVKAGGRGCMASHNSVNGRPCHSSTWLLTHVFRTELGCDKCLIGTDFRDIELLSDMNTANTSRYSGLPPDTDASIQALAAGVDQDLGGYSYGSLLQASQHGLLPKETADEHGITAAAERTRHGPFNSNPLGVNCRFRPPACTYDAPPWGCIVRVVSQTKSRKYPTEMHYRPFPCLL